MPFTTFRVRVCPKQAKSNLQRQSLSRRTGLLRLRESGVPRVTANRVNISGFEEPEPPDEIAHATGGDDNRHQRRREQWDPDEQQERTDVLETVETLAIACQSKVFLVHVAPALSPELRDVPVPQQHRDTASSRARWNTSATRCPGRRSRTSWERTALNLRRNSRRGRHGASSSGRLYLPSCEKHIQTRHEEQSDDSLCGQTPDGSDGHGLKHIRAFAQVQSKGREADHRGNGGH